VILESAGFPVHGLQDFVELGDERSKQARPSDEKKEAVSLDDTPAYERLSATKQQRNETKYIFTPSTYS
jgi:hypothetical protein